MTWFGSLYFKDFDGESLDAWVSRFLAWRDRRVSARGPVGRPYCAFISDMESHRGTIPKSKVDRKRDH
jgi:hypothetical protein